MHIKETTKKAKNKVYENYLLVESLITPKGPRQKTICSLGHLKGRPRKEWLLLAQKVETTLKGQLTFEKEEPEVKEIVKKAKAFEAQEKIYEAIGRIKERYPRVARYYKLEYDSLIEELSYKDNTDKKSIAEFLDGSYMLRTDRTDMSDDEIWRSYSLLTRCENTFRNMKSPLCEGPIFHQLKRRVQTHIFLCILVYHLLVAIEKTLLDEGIHTSCLTIKDTQKTHMVSLSTL